MLRADEAGALRAAHARSRIQWVLLAGLMVLLAVLPTLLYVVTDGRLDHLLGRDEQVSARVDAIQEDGKCRYRPKYWVEVSWSGHTAGSGGYKRCGEVPEVVGQTVQVWVGQDGEPIPSSPTTDRLGLGTLGLGLAAIVGGLAAYFVIRAGRARIALLRRGGNLLQSAVPVEVSNGHQGRPQLRATVPTSELATHPFRITGLVHTRPGSAPTTGKLRDLAGTWSLSLATETGSRERIGLLERGQERCWVALRQASTR
ncbi:hypothetical protein [Ornithinimicrobium cavernae]|uniref:hypothetical protein n=1 Tax=Ornithinimicrobium cavernae TaxID=2666047 RepID=UPI0012B17787|nr:hypothetical protein [Ornithinimicrobium cavernae]